MRNDTSFCIFLHLIMYARTCEATLKNRSFLLFFFVNIMPILAHSLILHCQGLTFPLALVTMNKKFSFNGHEWDFSSPVFRYDGKPVRSRRTISIMYVNALRNFGYHISVMGNHKLPPVMHHPEDCSYKIVRDCLEHTISVLSSVTSDSDRQWLCSQSLTSSGYFETSDNKRVYVAELYDRFHDHLSTFCVDDVSSVVNFLNSVNGGYIIIR